MSRAALLSWTLALAPAPEDQGEAEAGPERTSQAPDQDAAALFASGQAKYETHDYAGAITDFTAAYDLALTLEDAQIRDEALARLAYNLARAHVSAFDVDADASHLKIGRKLVADFRGHERAQGRDPDADTDLARLEQDLRSREQQVAHDRPDSDSNSNDASERDPKLAKRTRGQRRAGIALLAITPAFAGLAVTGGILGDRAAEEFATVTTADARLDARSRGRAGDVMLGVGVGLAAASALTGVTLLVVGRKRGEQPDADEVSRVRPEVRVGLRPTGLVVQGRF